MEDLYRRLLAEDWSFACVAGRAAYNASHASESDGPLRLPSVDGFSESTGRAPIAAGPAPDVDHLPSTPALGPSISPPSARSAPRPAASGSRRSVALRVSPRRRPPAARAAARPPLIAARGPAAHRPSHLGRRGRPSFAPGRTEVVLVHRLKPPLWALPKGTPDAGETLAETATRETREETGLEVEIEEPISAISYFFVHGRTRFHKTVHFFLMRPIGGAWRTTTTSSTRSLGCSSKRRWS